MRKISPNIKRLPLVFETVGVEIESPAATPYEVAQIIDKSLFKDELNSSIYITHDASIEFKVASINTQTTHFTVNSPDVSLGIKSSKINGFELVSKPLIIDEMEFFLFEILRIFNKAGFFTSNRSSTHIHVGIPQSLEYLKSSIAFSLGFEDVFYAIAGMRGKYRGEFNNSAYTRPVSHGICIPLEKEGWIKIPSVKHIFNSKDIYSAMYGLLINPTVGLEKYHPVRYLGINPYSILEKGTLEFRTANATLNFDDLFAYTKFCQMVAELISKYTFTDFLKYSAQLNFVSKEFYKEKLETIFKLAEKNTVAKPDINVLKTIKSIIDSNEPFKIANSDLVLTHTSSIEVPEYFLEMGIFEIITRQPINAGVVTIHNIDEYKISIFR